MKTSLIEKIKTNMMLAKREPEGKKLSLLLSTLYGECVHAHTSKKLNPNKMSLEEVTIKTITKFVKNNNETIALLKKVKKDFSSQESENVILEAYLPKQMTTEELTKVIVDIISSLGATSPKQMGLIMKTLKEAHSGLYDGKMASKIVKQELIKCQSME